MLLLYTSPSCPYCRKVEACLHEMNLPYEARDIAESPTYRDELVVTGGRLQVPFLVDTTRNVALYESSDIIAHLQTSYGGVTQ